MTGERNFQFVGLCRERVEHVARHARMDLQQVVAGLLLRDHGLDGHGNGRRGLGVERWPRCVDERADDFPLCRAFAIHEMPWIAQHPANRGHTIGDIEKQRPLDRLIRGRTTRNVRVHLGQARHQELALAFDADGAGWNLRLRRRGDRCDLSLTDDDRLVGQDRVVLHREHADAHESR